MTWHGDLAVGACCGTRTPLLIRSARMRFVFTSVPLCASAMSTSSMADMCGWAACPRCPRRRSWSSARDPRPRSPRALRSVASSNTCVTRPRSFAATIGLAVAHGDAGAFLAAVLQRLQPEAGHAGHVLAGGEHAEHGALLLQAVGTRPGKHGRAHAATLLRRVVHRRLRPPGRRPHRCRPRPRTPADACSPRRYAEQHEAPIARSGCRRWRTQTGARYPQLPAHRKPATTERSTLSWI